MRTTFRAAVVGAVATLVVSLGSPGYAFSLGAHEAIVTAALPVGTVNPGDVDQGALNQIVGNFFTGKGNLGSDRHQFDAFRHFDSAPNPATICALANQAWSSFVGAIDAGTTVINAQNPDPFQNAPDARSAFGALTHSLQDFYSHSNWIELGLRSPAPLFPSCGTAALPADLQTGFFRPSAFAPLSGCPIDGHGRPTPPAPFRYCHLTLNKDKPQDHGADIVPGSGGKNFHTVAADLARAHTTVLYQLIRARLVARTTPGLTNIGGECAARKLFQVSAPGTCLNLTGTWRVIVSDPVTGYPTLGQAWMLNQINDLTVGGTVTAGCGQLNIATFRPTSSGAFVGHVPSCPVPVTGPCPAQINLPLTLTYAGPFRVQGVLTRIDVSETPTQCLEDARITQVFTLARIT